jgi:hypothetical protein
MYYDCIRSYPVHIRRTAIVDGILHPIRFIFPQEHFPNDRETLYEITRQTQEIPLAHLAAGLFSPSLQETILRMSSMCHKTRYGDQDVALDTKHIIRKINSAQKALYQDFHEYWLERCAETIAWEKDNGITNKAKRQKNLPSVPTPGENKTPSTIKIPKEKGSIHSRILERKAQLEISTSAAISFILRKPMKNNHNKFIYDISKGTVKKKIKTGKRAIPTADSKEEKSE